jgi:hypothetical protein
MTDQPIPSRGAFVFNPNDHLRQIKSGQTSQDYLDVKWRLVWFRSLCPNGTIDTEELAYDLDREMTVEVYVYNQEKKRSERVQKTANGYARYRAIVTDGKGGRATGTKSECRASFDDFGEKAETGAIGRALAALGFGTQFTGDELYEGDRIVDSPVDQPTSPENTRRTPVPDGSTEATDQQLASIRKIAEHLGGKVYDVPKTYQQAKELIATLSAEYRQRKAT